nr:OmpA family protein [Halomonas socia]
MNPSTLIGILASILLLASVLLFTAESPASFLNLPGLAIVITGTLAATFISYPLREVVRVTRLVGIVFRRENTYARDDIKELVDISRLWFQGDVQADLTGDGRRVLDGLLGMLKTFDGRISVEGHTDDVPIATPRFPSNWELSGAHAIAVVRHLQEQEVPESRLRAIGYADTQPLESNATPEGRAANRRVELVLHEGPRR